MVQKKRDPQTTVAFLNDCALAHKHLVDVEEDVAALDDHPLDRQVLANVLRVTDLRRR